MSVLSIVRLNIGSKDKTLRRAIILITCFSNEIFLWTNINVTNRVQALMQKPPDEVNFKWQIVRSQMSRRSHPEWTHQSAIDRATCNTSHTQAEHTAGYQLTHLLGTLQLLSTGKTYTTYISYYTCQSRNYPKNTIFLQHCRSVCQTSYTSHR